MASQIEVLSAAKASLVTIAEQLATGVMVGCLEPYAPILIHTGYY